jgi:DNA-binding MarR family transcriptional regulator
MGAMVKVARKPDVIHDPWEMMVYRALRAAADEGRECPSADDLSDLIGSSSVSTTVAIIQRLERKGMIRVQRFQRCRRVRITETGKWTKEPTNKAQPWREQAITLSALQAERPDMIIEVTLAADRAGMTLAEYFRTCFWAGFERTFAVPQIGDVQ